MELKVKILNKLFNKQDINDSISIQAYDLLTGKTYAIFKNIKECENFGYNSNCVDECCKGITESYKGLGWTYIKK